jgi:predicted GH43/DUF377 family glycosyl hydrolase
MKLLRFKGNPILKPKEENPWERGAVFNCAAVYDGKLVHMLYRAIGEYENYISRLGYAQSQDGFNFKRISHPAFEPQANYEAWGCEDPRITKIGGNYYITYTALFNRAFSEKGSRVALASTKDFKSFTRYGVILPQFEDKDTVLFPEKIKGKYVMFHRIMPNIWIAYSDDLLKWYGHKVVMRPRKGSWDCEYIGSGAPPLKTENGWLLVYHGVDAHKVYRLGAALFDLNDPSILLARQDEPILEPEENYERYGDISNTVFTCGAIEKNASFYVYYGAADKTICVATVDRNQAIGSFR